RCRPSDALRWQTISGRRRDAPADHGDHIQRSAGLPLAVSDGCGIRRHQSPGGQPAGTLRGGGGDRLDVVHSVDLAAKVALRRGGRARLTPPHEQARERRMRIMVATATIGMFGFAWFAQSDPAEAYVRHAKQSRVRTTIAPYPRAYGDLPPPGYT